MTNRVRVVREARGMSAAELARRAGISRSHLYLIEQGRTEPTVSVVLGLCRALGVSFDELFGQHTDDQRVVDVS